MILTVARLPFSLICTWWHDPSTILSICVVCNLVRLVSLFLFVCRNGLAPVKFENKDRDITIWNHLHITHCTAETFTIENIVYLVRFLKFKVLQKAMNEVF